VAKLTCISESVYQHALTRGKIYDVLAVDADKDQVRVAADDGRMLWFSRSCFAEGAQEVPRLVSFIAQDPWGTASRQPIEVTVRLSDGSKRFCWVATPQALQATGDCLSDGSTFFHAPNRNLLILSHVTQHTVELLLRHLDAQGELEGCSDAFTDDLS
jgi:hypothetical protein